MDDLELESAIGKELKALRASRRLTQEELAWSAELERNTVSLIERGISSPTARILWKLAKVLEIKPSEFFALVEARLERARLEGVEE